jgi:ketosteroid isomerase-like protein
MGWTWGQYQVLAEGETISTGKYLNVWTRQADGRWKVRADIGNQRPAPTSTGK